MARARERKGWQEGVNLSWYQLARLRRTELFIEAAQEFPVHHSALETLHQLTGDQIVAAILNYRRARAESEE